MIYLRGAQPTAKLEPQTAVPRLLSISALSAYLSIPKATLYTWVSLKKIPGECVVKLGRSLRFDLEAVDRWVSAQKAASLPVNNKQHNIALDNTKQHLL
jgi:excisionase family DNA binding protein